MALVASAAVIKAARIVLSRADLSESETRCLLPLIAVGLSDEIRAAPRSPVVLTKVFMLFKTASSTHGRFDSKTNSSGVGKATYGWRTAPVDIAVPTRPITLNGPIDCTNQVKFWRKPNQ
jgi:hypothetical protein